MIKLKDYKEGQCMYCGTFETEASKHLFILTNYYCKTCDKFTSLRKLVLME